MDLPKARGGKRGIEKTGLRSRFGPGRLGTIRCPGSSQSLLPSALRPVPPDLVGLLAVFSILFVPITGVLLEELEALRGEVRELKAIQEFDRKLLTPSARRAEADVPTEEVTA
jgi:hypothetical protein